MNEFNYKIEWDMVALNHRTAQFYRGEDPICKPADVPDEFWHKVKRTTDDPWEQYNQLKHWAETGEQLIRNVKLFKAVRAPEWELVE